MAIFRTQQSAAQMKEKVLSVRCRVYRAVAGRAACPSYPVAGGTRALAATRSVVGRQEKPSVASERERERERVKPRERMGLSDFSVNI